MTILQCYAPTNETSDDEKEDFYNQLQDLVDEELSATRSTETGNDNQGFEHVRRGGLGERSCKRK